MEKVINYNGLVIRDGNYSREELGKIIKKCEMLTYDELFELLDELEGTSIQSAINISLSNKINGERMAKNYNNSRQNKLKQKIKVNNLNKVRW